MATRLENRKNRKPHRIPNLKVHYGFYESPKPNANLKKNQNPVQSTMNTKTKKTGVFWHRNLKPILKNSQNCKIKNPNAPLFTVTNLQLTNFVNKTKLHVSCKSPLQCSSTVSLETHLSIFQEYFHLYSLIIFMYLGLQ